MGQHSVHHVAVIGAGFGGLGMAAALRDAGIDDFTVIEKADSLGGTWRDNVYPGAACDVPCSLYSYSFWPGLWSRRFPPQREILHYLRDFADRRGLTSKLRFGSGVAAARFDEERTRWQLTMDNGDTVEAAAVVCAVGQLNRPALPDIPGRDDFAGPSWHSARWDHSVDLAGRRVAVIGTGASAIQFVPEVAKAAAHVDVYQRSAPYVLPKGDRPYGATERVVRRSVTPVAKADRLRIFLYGELLTSGFVKSDRFLATPMKLWRGMLDKQISDLDLRARCVPDYVMGCKRVLFSNDWYPTLARPEVDLVTDPIERITADGVVTAGGVTRPADVVIYGTGFSTLDFLAPMPVTGLGGQDLRQTWQDGAEAYLGISIRGFPNFFVLYGPNTNLGGNSIIYMLEGQIGYALAAIETIEREGLSWIDVRPDVQQAFTAWVDKTSHKSVWERGCHSWYTTASGRNTNNWPDMTYRYRQRVRRFDLGSYQVMPKQPG